MDRLLRHQVLLTDWQTDHLKLMAKQNDLSFSEVIRLTLLEGIAHTNAAIRPGNEKSSASARRATFGLRG